MQDRNFDDIAEKFARNIYGTTKGRIRQAVLWQDLENLLAGLPQRPLRILDAGGGQGQIACQLAARGHRVILCDISAQMLQRAAQHAEEQGVSARMELVQSPAQEMHRHLAEPVDLVLFHAVLEWVAQPQAVLAVLEKCLAPGGALSLMFYNYNGLLMLNTLVGNMEYVKLGMPKRKRRSLSPDHPLDPVQVYGWLEQLGLTISGKTGVRVFHDYLRDKTQQIGAFDDLLALEQRYCRQEPFVSLGRYIHVMAHKKGDMKDPL
ncbi:tRNA uridine 5-oxyacetic acid(34) methyltransferase CmoM [Edwardsiella piscicida]